MARKKNSNGNEKIPYQRDHAINFEFVPTLTLPLVSFMNSRMGLATDDRGSLCINTTDDRFTFKIKDILGIVDTQDDYIIFHLKPSDKNAKSDEMLAFYKKDIKIFYVEFSSEVHYKSEREKSVDRAFDSMTS